MRKTTEYKAENRLTVDIEGLMAMLSCGEVTAKKIADYAEACILQSPADSDAFQSGRCAKHNGRPETMYF